MLDHISRGRLNFGIAASALPSDWEMFQIDVLAGENREMTRESIDCILNLWTQEPGWVHRGKYWKAAVPQPAEPGLYHHIKPLQQPHPPIGVAGLSSPSPTLEMAGERGWIPMSLNLNPGYVKGHWDSYAAGAARAGRDVTRRDWRMVREIFVADTDEEAWEQSVGGMMGPDDARLLPAPPRRLRLQTLPEGGSLHPRRRGHRRVLRGEQLVHRLA